VKTLIAVSAVAAVALTTAVAPSAAAPQPVGNFVSLHLGPAVGQFRGAVHSDVLQCIDNRKVRIVRVSGPQIRVGKGYADSRGHFSIQTSESSGDWIAKVKHETLSGVECAGAMSKRRSAG
jgi:hypothetical protein